MYKLTRGLILAAAVAVAAPGVAAAQSGDELEALDELDKLDALDALEGLDALKALDGLGGNALYSCSKHQKLVLDGKKLGKKQLGGKKTPIFLAASGHCKVTVRNLRVEAVIGFALSGHANVTIEDTVIAGGELAIAISGHAKATLTRSKAEGKMGVNASGHSTVLVDAKSTVSKQNVGSKYAKIIIAKK